MFILLGNNIARQTHYLKGKYRRLLPKDHPLKHKPVKPVVVKGPRGRPRKAPATPPESAMKSMKAMKAMKSMEAMKAMKAAPSTPAAAPVVEPVVPVALLGVLDGLLVPVEPVKATDRKNTYASRRYQKTKTAAKRAGASVDEQLQAARVAYRTACAEFEGTNLE